MVDHDNLADGDPEPDGADPGSSGPIGPRRSTYTPPPASDDEDAIVSDDDLADVLFEDFEKATHSDTIHVVPGVVPDGLPGDDEVLEDTIVPGPPPADAVVDNPEETALDAPVNLADETPEAAVDETPAEIYPLEDILLDDTPLEEAPAVVYDLDDTPLGEAPIDEVPMDEAPLDEAPLGEAPLDETPIDEAPAVVYDLDDSPAEPDLPQRPVRQSLPVDELALVFEGRDAPSTLEAMEQLEEQLRLREQDAREFAEWQASAEASGSAGAMAEIENARSEFQDVLSPVAAEPSAPLPPAPTHTFRVDEALESELSTAPPPMTAPISDLPPPPGHELLPAKPSPEAVAFAPPGTVLPDSTPAIPDLVEPTSPPAAASFDFGSLLNGAAEGTDEAIPFRDDDVGDTDQALSDLLGPFPVTSEGVAIIPDAPIAPVEPIASPRIPTSEHVILGEEPSPPPMFRVEESSVEPTAVDQRVGRAARMFWLWFAANSSVVSLAFGGAVFALGMSLRQAIVATLAGVALSFLPLGLGTLAGKWSGQPTMIVSRAAFGHLGNILPAVLALVVRLFWGAVLLWFLAAGTARILAGAELGGGLSEPQLTIIGLAAGFLLALVIAFFGYGLLARFQLIVTVISAILIIGLIVITWPAVSISTALTVGDGPWILVVTGAVLVFSFVGLVWAVSSADLARYQRPGGSGAASMLWSTFGATIPAFVLIAYGAVLAASNPDVATGLVETPLDTIALLIPTWYPIPLIAALALSLLSGVVISIYSGGFALQATGATMRRSASVVIVGVALAGVAILLALSVGDFTLLLRDVATSLAVPVAAWAGIFAAEMMIRNRRFDTKSLVTRGGVYSDVNWTNLTALVLASAIGFGLTTATVGWLSWQGYLFPLLDVAGASDLAASDLGVLVALVLGLLVPIIGGIPGIRRQEESAIVRTRNPED
ncbi:MAG TPA: cytosine permease [Terrimesophilobacter sp.]|nr:cytosine permease [Terrimesophilobacter sp.]